MRGVFSLAQELRAIRNGGKHLGTEPVDTPEAQSPERPWQADIDRLQQTMREVLRAVASLSGVELPGLVSDGHQKPGVMRPQLDIKTLKDRIRDDLEAYSSATAAEMAQRAEEQSRTALEKIQNATGNRIEHAVGEFREELRRRLASEEADVGVDVAKQSRERVVELVQTRTDEFARWVWLTCKGTETPIPVQIAKLLEPHVEETTARFIKSSRQRFHDALGEQERFSQDMLQGMQASFRSQINTLVQDGRQACEQNRDDAIGQIREVACTARELLSQDVAGFTERLRELGQGLTALGEKHIAASEEQLSTKSQTILEALETRIQQVTSAQLEEIHRLTQEFQNEAASQYESQLRDVLEASFQHSLEAYRQELARCTETALEEQRQAIRNSISDLQGRLERSAQILRGEIA